MWIHTIWGEVHKSNDGDFKKWGISFGRREIVFGLRKTALEASEEDVRQKKSNSFSISLKAIAQLLTIATPATLLANILFLSAMFITANHWEALLYFSTADYWNYAPVFVLIFSIYFLAGWAFTGFSGIQEPSKTNILIITVVVLLGAFFCGLMISWNTKNYRICVAGQNTPIAGNQAFPISHGLLLTEGAAARFIPWDQIRREEWNNGRTPDIDCNISESDHKKIVVQYGTSNKPLINTHADEKFSTPQR